MEGHAFGSLSMACYAVDAPRAATPDDDRSAAGLPDPAVIAPEDTNL